MTRLQQWSMCALLIGALAGCSDGGAPGGPRAGKVNPALASHGAEFAKRVEKVTDGVYVAIGYALANSIMLEGEDAIVIVDVTESMESAREVMAAFREITDKPVAALIYTHNHADHVFGGRGFVPEGYVPVYAHESTNYYINRFANIIRPAIEKRSARMFGTWLPAGEEGVVNAGIGPQLTQGGHGGGTVGLIRPNHSFARELDIEVSGIRMKLVHAPGETNDQIFVWLPEKRVLLPADNIYKSFPNLYTIRGTLYRDVLAWADSLDRMRALKPRYLVPSHTVPVSGEAEVAALLTDYADAIRFVHDQTIRGLNRGMGPDELVRSVRLPEHLREHPWLQEFYGTVEWSVRNVFNGYLGWFDGDAATLSPVSARERAESLIALAGGADAVTEAVEAALEQKRHAWAAELATHLIVADAQSERARRLKARALRELGYASVSANGRNYYLTQALELEGSVTLTPAPMAPDRIAFAKTLPIGEMMASLPVNLDPEKSADVQTTVSFRFTDSGEAWTLRVRRGVAALSEGESAEADLAVSVSTDTWADILLGERGVPAALASGDITLGNGVRDVPALVSFLLLFRS